MYKTNYFNNINLSSVQSQLESLSSSIPSLKQAAESSASSFKSAEWNANSSSILLNSYEALSLKLDEIKAAIQKYIEVIKIASEIDTIQKSMESDTDFDSLNTKATNIENKLKSFKTAVEGSSTGTFVDGSGTMKDTTSDSSGGLDPISPNIPFTPLGKEEYFSININKFSAAIDSFDDFRWRFQQNYEKFLSLSSMVSSDSYLRYVHGVVEKLFDNTEYYRQCMFSWMYNYETNISKIENALPDSAKKVSYDSSLVVKTNYNYPSMPDFDSYVKGGRTTEIVKPEPQKMDGSTESINNPSSNNPSSGGGSPYYGGTGGNGYNPSSGGGSTPGGTGPSTVGGNYPHSEEEAKQRAAEQSEQYRKDHPKETPAEKAVREGRAAAANKSNTNTNTNSTSHYTPMDYKVTGTSTFGGHHPTPSSNTNNNQNNSNNKNTNTTSARNIYKKWTKNTFGMN